MNQKKQNVSMSVIRRLPRYYRFLNELGILTVSAGLASKGMAIM